MKIAMMTAWNTDSGESIYAEAIGKAFLKLGHQLQVFSFIREDYHGEGFTTDEDEDYVIRCFGTSTNTNFLDPRPLLTSDYDIFILQDLGMLPKDNLAKIYHLIRKKAKTIHIFYDNKLTDDVTFFQFDWDAVVYFDIRQQFIKTIYHNSYYIPFPCFPLREGNKLEARKKLNLPLDKKIVYIFCQRGYSPYFFELTDNLKDVIILIVTTQKRNIPQEYFSNEKIIIREEEVLSKEKFDEYIFASDALILHKFMNKGYAVVSSTTYQAIGCLTPILAPAQSDYFVPFNEEVLRYSNQTELKENLLDIFQEGPKYRKFKKAAQELLENHSPQNIANKFIELFELL